jgi:hypothetical protein
MIEYGTAFYSIAYGEITRYNLCDNKNHTNYLIENSETGRKK